MSLTGSSHEPATHREWVEFDEPANFSPPAEISVISENRSPAKQSQNLNCEVPSIEKSKIHTQRIRTEDQNKAAASNSAKIVKQPDSSADDLAKIEVSLEEFQPASSSADQTVAKNNVQGIPGLNSTDSHANANFSNQTTNRMPNGKIVSTIMPGNVHCAWFIPAHFDPYKMPKSLISDSLTMPVETYVESMEKLTNDFRFRLYTVAYRRVIVLWFILCLFTLLVILLSGLGGLALFCTVLFWLLWTSVGVLICLHLKRLPRVVQLIHLHSSTLNSQHPVPSVSVHVTTPSDPVSFGRGLSDEQKAKFLIAKCSQSYVKALSRQTIRFPSRPSQGASEFTPSHCSHSYCLCQYLQVHYFEKAQRTLMQKIFLTDGVDWTSSTYVDPAAYESYVEDEIVKEALTSGVDLREYSKKIEEELKAVELDAVQDYIKEAESIANLHNQIRGCDDILKNMEDMLGNFQSDLGSISGEIQNLQELSVHMNVKLKNRQALRSQLSQFVDELHVPEKLIEVILKISASEREFLEQLHELQHKITFAKEQAFKDAHACLDVDDVLNKLKIKAIEKIREYLLQKIYQFRKPLINYQMVQSSMLKFRFYYEFLLANERQIAREIRDEYVETMSKVFWTYFKTYAGRLMRIQMDDSATSSDLLGAEDSSRGPAQFFGTKPNIRSKATVFTLGARKAVLGEGLEASIIVAHVSEEKNEKFPFELLFRSMQFALFGNVVGEFLFLGDFFMTSGQGAFDLFNVVMGKSLKILLKSVQSYANSSFDCISLILCLHIIYRYQDMMHKREVNVLDGYWQALAQCLWARFETVFDMNLDSIRSLDASKFSIPDCRPHYIVRRYAEFSSALASINLSWPDNRLQIMLQNLQVEMDNLLNRFVSHADFKSCAPTSPSNQNKGNSPDSKKQKFIFLMNNYDVVLSTSSQNVTGDTSESLAFQESLQSRTSEYIEELLFAYFGPLIAFIVECERLIEQGHQESLKRHADKIPILIKSFSNMWKKSIEQVNQEVITSFSSLKLGSNVIQKALTQLIQYYHRFQKVLSCPSFATCPARNDLVNIHHIMVEVKKYKPVY